MKRNAGALSAAAAAAAVQGSMQGPSAAPVLAPLVAGTAGPSQSDSGTGGFAFASGPTSGPASGPGSSGPGYSFMHEVSAASNPDILMQLTARQDLIIRISTVKAMKRSGCLLLETVQIASMPAMEERACQAHGKD